MRFLRYYKPRKTDECWPWTGTLDGEGYGVIGDDNRRQVRAHRVAYERANGPIPASANVLHHCDNPPCCNPAHLWLGSVIDNNEDKRQKGRHPHGESHPGAKISAADVRSIRAEYASHGGAAEIASALGLTTAAVHDIVYKRRWKHVG